MCSTCEELDTKIKSTSLDYTPKRMAVAEKLIYMRRVKNFCFKQKEIAQICKEKEEVGCLIFDYMQHLPLLKIPLQEMFHLQKL